MIVRTWRGWTAAEDSERYLGYLEETGISAYRKTPGNQGVLVLRRIVEDRAEFLMMSIWDSMDAIRHFAGADPARAVFYPRDDEFLVEREYHADHYEALRWDVSEAGLRSGD